MNRFAVAISLVIAAAAAAEAQAPPELALPAFLEKRVPEELASEGQLLSRANLTLRVEAVGDVLIVSLVDLNTNRVAASTKVDHVPADREAAVASVTHVAADLVTQIAGRAPAPPPAAPGLIDDRAERAAREVVDLKYQKLAIRFGATYELHADANTAVLTRRWVPYRGEIGQEIEPHEFYRLVGHPELADAYDHRRNVAIGGLVVGGLLAAASLVYVVESRCSVTDPSCDPSSQLGTELALTLAGGAVLTFGAWYLYHPHPISESDAKTLAARYNDGVRSQLGLPVVERHRLRDLRIAPYVTHERGGLALVARF